MPNPGCQTLVGYSVYISLNTSTAYSQGWNEAGAAWAAAGGLGMDRSGMPFLYDLEGYYNASPPPTQSLTTCRNAAKSFIDGWVAYMHTGITALAGVYGSQCSSYINDFKTIAHPADLVFFAFWNGNPSTSNTSSSCPLGTNWANHQRHKQYVSGHNETYGSVTIHLDNDCSDGSVYLSTSTFDSSSACL